MACKGKSSWPELVGVKGKKAEAIIESENPRVNAIIIDQDAIVPLDFRCDRVWVRVNKRGIVTRTPQIG